MELIPFAHSYQMTKWNPNFTFLYKNKTSDFRKRKLAYVPVITLYGKCHKNQNICVHVHGYFPYFYIEKPENFDEYCFCEDIEHKFRKIFKKYDNLIFDIDIVSRTDIYGFQHSKEFIKLTLYDYYNIRKLAQMIKAFYNLRTYEHHLDIFVHFYSDYNILGQHPLNIAEYKYRKTNQTLFQKHHAFEIKDLQNQSNIK